MQSGKKKYFFLISLIIMLIFVQGYYLISNSVNSKEVKTIISDFQDSEIIEITAMINSIQHEIVIKKDLMNEFKKHVFNIDWSLVSDNSFSSFGDTSFRVFFSGNTEISDIHIIGKKYMLISVYDIEKNKPKTYKLEVNWLDDSYEQIKYLVRDSR